MPYVAKVPTTRSERTPLAEGLALRWLSEDGAAVMRTASGERLGFVYRVRRWGTEGWCNTGDDGYWATANLAANALAGRGVAVPVG